MDSVIQVSRPVNGTVNGAALLRLFPSSPESFGVRLEVGRANGKGKCPAKYTTYRRAVSPADAAAHLAGKRGLVLKPDLPGGVCVWAAIDIDGIYQDEEKRYEILRNIHALKLPIHPFASKSGGLHGFVFFKAPVKLGDARAQLGEWAARLGYPDAEVFPKKVGKDKLGYGITLPGFGEPQQLEGCTPNYADCAVNGTGLPQAKPPKPTEPKPGATPKGLISAGQRHKWLISQAAKYRRWGDEEEAIYVKLKFDYESRCEQKPQKPDQEIRNIAKWAGGLTTAGLAGNIDLTDGGNADYVQECHPGRIKHEQPHTWYIADEYDRWRVDRTGQAENLIELDMREKYVITATTIDADEKARHSHARMSCNAAGIANCGRILRNRPEVSVEPGTFDTDPWLLGVRNGVLNLRDGKLLEGRLDLLVAKRAQVTYDPHATCDAWGKYLLLVQPKAEMRQYLQQLAGLTLTGIIGELCFVFFHGPGANGKSVFIRVLQGLLGPDYAFAAKKSLFFLNDRNEPRDIDKADLDGRRLITTSETVTKHFNRDFIKQYTGGDLQHGREHYKSGKNFMPTGKIIISANEKPHLEEFEEAMRRRFVLVPWRVTIPFEDRIPLEELVAMLLKDSSGILNWALEGLAELQKQKLRFNLPEPVLEATEEYFNEEDKVMRFAKDWCANQTGDTYTDELRDHFQIWLNEPRGKFSLSQKRFNAALKRILGNERFERGHANKAYVKGYGLNEEGEKAMLERKKEHHVAFWKVGQ